MKIDPEKYIRNNFPKKRTELPEAYKKIYVEHYAVNRGGTSTASRMSQLMESWLHKKTAADVAGIQGGPTLEIGAGNLNHLDYENSGPYDIVEPFREMYEASDKLGRVRNVFNDIGQVGNLTYKRILAIAVFEHLADLPDLVAQTCRLLDRGGSLRVAIPNEGTILWKLGWVFTTGLEFRLRYGLNYSVLRAFEHVNTADDIEIVLRYFYAKVKCSVLGINRSLAFYRFYECSDPDMGKADEYLSTRN
jgi:hypothetical protein